MIYLSNYTDIVGEEVISNAYKKARKLSGLEVLHVNSTFYGGGVAEMLSSLVPLMNDVGIDAGWRILHGTPDFFTITKKVHNGLQGDKINVSDMKKKLYIQASKDFSVFTHIDHDCVIIHDPQPLPLIKYYRNKQPWVWRCHIDLSNPNKELWDFLRQFIIRYDKIILSSEKYQKKNLPVEHKLIHPAIDPLTQKNMQIPDKVVERYINKLNIPTDKPIITQISRFDKWKDPEGVIDIYKLVKKKVDCRLILCGSMAADDPEGYAIYDNVVKKANNLIEKKDILLISGVNDIMLNAIQRTSDVIIQKSLKEGFGLTVTEAMWKSKPVLASNVGGIPLQIDNGKNGFLFDPLDVEGFAKKTMEILKNPKMGKEVGKNAKEKVRKNFLITRLLMDYLDLLDECCNHKKCNIYP